MKQFLSSIIMIFGFACAIGLMAQNVHIPDTNLKRCLIINRLINTNGDGEVQLGEAEAFNGKINCAGENISHLIGIEAFTSLTVLDCSNNRLVNLDVSKNVKLAQLYCDKNQLVNLDLSKNIALNDLSCTNNQLLSLNIANGRNKYFKEIRTYANPNLTCIQVDNPAYSYKNWLKKYNFAFGGNITFSKKCIK